MRKVCRHNFQRILSLLTALFFVSTVFAQTATIRGVVKDPNGLPLQGASVTVEGTRRGVVTDANGVYSIVVPPGNQTVVVTYVGMQQQKQTVNATGGATDLNFNLQSGGDLNRVVIVGSRSATVRSNTQTAVPVDVISVRDLQATGQIEPTQMLNMIAPSFNSSRQTIADGTDHIDPATLRGLGPDQVLVLVNGRRRYNTALLNVNGTIGRGSVGTDLNSIPPEAIERIEVLRDGASSQYGSDAIAGVVNVVLKKNTKGATVYSHYGKFYAGDGENIQAGLTQGLKLGSKGGFLTLSGDFRHREPTNRVGDYQGPVYVSNNTALDAQLVAQNNFNRKNNMAIGQSELKNYGFVLNGGLPFSATTQLFFTGSMNWRDGKAAGFYRYPYQTSQVIAELYPNGFLPYINSEIKDKSAIVGLEGKAGRWNWDISQTAGGNSFAFDITNTNNASQFALGKSAPTEFDAGQLKFYQYVSNANFSRDFGTSMGLKSFNLATGAELRFDNYQIVAGEEASYRNYAPTSGRVGGAQVFPGFQPVNAVDETRTVVGVYADLETDLTDRLLANAAARFENYSDFGSNVAGKIALRYKIAEALSLRGSFSNGFRAPSMHQRYFSSVATVFISNGSTLVPVQNGTFNNESDVAKAFGMPSLKAEKSLNYSTGVTARFEGFSLTVDGYIVEIKDRIVLTGAFTKSSPVVAQLLANYPEVNSAAFFTNAIDTRTKGLDVVLSRNARIGKSTLTGSLAANFNETEVTESRPLPDQLKGDPTLAEGVLFDREQRTRIERGQPRDKITLGLTYNLQRFTVNTRITRFGKVASADRLNPALDESFDSRIVSDLSVGYRIGNFATLTVGANNIGNIYPERLEQYGNTSLGRFIYSRNATQFGFNGGYYFTSLVFDVSNL